MNPPLEGERTRLRRRQAGDFERSAAWAANGPARYPRAVSGVGWLAAAYGGGGAGATFVVETASGVPIGDCSLRPTRPEERTGQLSLTIGEAAYRNCGYGTDAAHTLCRFAFEKLGLERVTVEVAGGDRRAVRVYQRLGFRVEARRRDGDFRNGRAREVLTLGLLRGELRNPMEVGDGLTA